MIGRLNPHMTLVSVIGAAIALAIAACSGATGKIRPIEPDRNSVTALAFSPAGDALLAGTFGGEVYVCDLASPVAPRRVCQPGAPVTWIAMSSNEEDVLTVSGCGSVQCWDARSGALRFQYGEEAQPFSSPVMSYDGTEVLVATREGAALLDVPTGECLREVQHDGASQVAMSVDGRYLLTASMNSIRIWDRETGTEVAADQATGRRVVKAAGSADVERFVIAFVDGLSTFDLSTGAVSRRFAEEDWPLNVCVFSAGGTRALLIGLDAQVWDVTARREAQRFSKDNHLSDTVAISHDGGRFADATRGSARVWDMDSARLLQTVGPCR